MPNQKYTDEQYAEIDSLVAQGASWKDAADTVGVPWRTAYMRSRRRKDPTPGGGGNQAKPKPPRVEKPKATDDQLAAFFARGAVLPAIPAQLILRCDFCANHFAVNGPTAAARLVELSREHPALRSVMEVIWREWQKGAWAGMLASYLGIPLAHHLAPDYIYKYLTYAGMPPRNTPTNPHVHTNGNGNAPPVDTPFAGLDLETLMSMAKTMGIEFDLPDMTTPDVPDVNPEPEYDADATTADDTDDTEPAETASPETDTESTVETVESDSDTGE